MLPVASREEWESALRGRREEAESSWRAAETRLERMKKRHRREARVTGWLALAALICLAVFVFIGMPLGIAEITAGYWIMGISGGMLLALFFAVGFYEVITGMKEDD